MQEPAGLQSRGVGAHAARFQLAARLAAHAERSNAFFDVRFPTCAERAIYEITADLAGSVFRKSGQADGFEKRFFHTRARQLSGPSKPLRFLTWPVLNSPFLPLASSTISIPITSNHSPFLTPSLSFAS